MASNTASTSSGGGTTQEFSVRVPKLTTEKFSIMKFNPANNVQFDNLQKEYGVVKLERENNFKQYKVANDIDLVPHFGAGSEFGREQREEARRKKFGVSKKIYNPEDQPWILKLGAGKQARKFKGVKEGGITDNASYFVFRQCPDGAFEALPVNEWYNFTPVAKYKRLDADEAEDQFKRRDKTLNFFSIMVNKKMTKDEESADEEEKEAKKTKAKGKKGKKKKDFLLTELDEWAVLSDSDESKDSDASKEENSDSEKKPTKKSKKKKVRKLAKQKGSDAEAEEESDDVDEGREVDYMTDTDSEDDEMYTDNVKTDKYEETGVEDAEGLRKIIESDEEEEEKKKEEDEQEEEEEDAEDAEKPKKDSDSESSSGSDSDLDKDENIMSALFMQKKDKKKKSASKESSRSNTPTVDDKGQKRKTPETDSPAAKKVRTASPVPSTSSAPGTPSGAAGSVSATPPPVIATSEGITDEVIKKYLMRKPTTAKELLQRVKSKYPNVEKDKLVTAIAAILKKVNPSKKKDSQGNNLYFIEK